MNIVFIPNINLGNNSGKGINKLFTVHGKKMIFTLDTKDDIDAWAAATIKYVLPLLPKELFFAKVSGKYKESGNSAFRRSDRFVGDKKLDEYFQEKINKMRVLDDSAFAPSIKGLGGPFSASYDTNIGKTDAKIQR